MIEWLVLFAHTLWQLTLEMAPWLLLGFAFAGILKVLVPTHKIHAYLGKKGFASNLRAAVVGVPLPLCSCGVIPTGVSLFKNGASHGATHSFLISTPQTGIDSFFATYAILGWPLAVLRPIIAFVSGILGGSIADTFISETENATQKIPEPIGTPKVAKTWKEKLIEILDYGFVEMMADIAKWLIIGLLLATLISVVVPPDFIANTVDNMALEFLLVLLIAIPLYVCATGSIPIAMVLLLKGLSPGAVLLFLMAGPATNAATMVVISQVMGKRSLFLYVFSITLTAALFGMLINWLIPVDFILSHVPNIGQTGGEMHFGIFSVLCALVLIALMLNVFRLQFFAKTKSAATTDVELMVEGMTCQNCKRKVETSLLQLDGVQGVSVTLETKKVAVEGAISEKALRQKINAIGFKVIEKSSTNP